MPLDTPTEGTERPRILVIDDSRVIRRAIGKTLSSQFDVTEAEDGEQGWEALQRDPSIEVVISDLEMPRLDGRGLLARIRACEGPLRDMPVIVITGADDEEARAQAFAAGASDFVTKPIDNVQLLARVRSHSRLEETTRKLAETTQALEEQATQDPLTQLATRRSFLQCAARDVAFASRHGAVLSLIRFAIDDFKGLFARFGDAAADALLAELAQLLLGRIRQEDTAARIAGAEFAVLIPSAGRVDAAVFADRVRAAVNGRAFQAIGGEHITLSVGIASLGGETTTVEALIAVADRHVQFAQAAGGNRVETGAVRRSSPPSPPPPTSQAPLSVDAALAMLTEGRLDALDPHLPDLTRRLIPLLELANRRLGLGLGFAIKSLTEKTSR